MLLRHNNGPPVSMESEISGNSESLKVPFCVSKASGPWGASASARRACRGAKSPQRLVVTPHRPYHDHPGDGQSALLSRLPHTGLQSWKCSPKPSRQRQPREDGQRAVTEAHASHRSHSV